MYNTGIWLGVAALFCWGYVVFLLWAFVAWRILTSYSLREWILLLLGFATPWLLIGTWLFWNDQLPLLWENGIVTPTRWLAFDWTPYFYWPTLLGLVLYGLLGLVVFLSAGSFYFKQKMQAQKVLSALYWMIPIGGFPVLFHKDLSLLQLLVWTVPLSTLVAIGFHRLRPSTAESLFWLMLFVLIGLHIWPLIQGV